MGLHHHLSIIIFNIYMLAATTKESLGITMHVHLYVVLLRKKIQV